MLDAIKNFFDSNLNQRAASSNEHDKAQASNLASAALLLEVMHSDHELDEREANEFTAVLQDSLGIPDESIEELTTLAESRARDATSLYEFTRLINDEYDYPQKVALIENMWRIAFSDETLDKYEEHLIRKISDLIYVSHSDFIQSKLRVRNGQNSD
jgi:uncharacterized tellurite resistance protein B-like protein